MACTSCGILRRRGRLGEAGLGWCPYQGLLSATPRQAYPLHTKGASLPLSIRCLALRLFLAVWAFGCSPALAAADAPHRSVSDTSLRAPSLADVLGPFPWKTPTVFRSEDDPWSREFGLPSVDGNVNCAVKFGNDLIVGGSFQVIGGIAARNIARWDGSAWHPLGEGLEREVTCMTVYHGALIVGGRFQYVEGSLSLHLAKWDGTSWSPMSASRGTYYCCYELNALAVYQDDLIAAGDFGRYEGPEFRGIRRWDGTAWLPFGAGVDGPVQTVLAAGDSLYVAGRFETAGGVPARGIALWDGNAWSPLGSGIPYRGWGTGVRSLIRYQGRLLAGGDFDSAGAVASVGLGSWDGSSWSALEGFNPGWVTAMAESDGVLEVGSFPYLQQWDGAQWRSGPAGANGSLYGETKALRADESGLIAVGQFSIEPSVWGPVAGFNIARWDGGDWIPYEPWTPAMHGLAAGPGWAARVVDLAAVGDRLAATGWVGFAGTGTGWLELQGITTWDGSGWSAIPFGPSAGWTYGTPEALLGEGDTLYAAGQFRFYPEGDHAPVLRWEKDAWTRLDTLSEHGSCLLRYHGRLVLGTQRRSSNDPTAAGVHLWSGHSWDPVGRTASIDQFHGVAALTEHDGLLVAAGSFTSIDGVEAEGVAAWDGNSWKSLGGPPGGYFGSPLMWDIASYDGKLVVAGAFADGDDSKSLMLWDGVSWNLFPGIAGPVTALSVIGGRLYAGGDLRLGSSPEPVSVAIWDGVRWTPFGSGVNGWIGALCEFRGDLYVGGGFSRAGGASSFGIARRAGFTEPAPRATLWISRAHPNPAPSEFEFSFGLDRGGPVRVSVHDARGREVAILEDDSRPAGTYFRRWNGRDGSGRAAPAGVYFIRLRSASGAVVSRKIVRLR